MKLFKRKNTSSAPQPLYEYNAPTSSFEIAPMAPDAPVPDASAQNRYHAYSGKQYSSPVNTSLWDGETYFGGMGAIEDLLTDYWAARKRSVELFTKNKYAFGLIRRLLTIEIGTGIYPESTPVADMLPWDENRLAEWTENVEQRYQLWGKNPQICDYYGQKTMRALQRQVRNLSLIGGDCLIVERTSVRTGTTNLQVIEGERVVSPYLDQNAPREGHTIEEGIEFDRRGRPVAAWVLGDDDEVRRQPFIGERSGRRIAWMVYGLEKLPNQPRGTPLLTYVMQNLKEIDRYRDASLRKALINSIYAMFVTKDANVPGSGALGGGASRKSSVSVKADDEPPRQFRFNEMGPGIVIDELAMGEDIKPGPQGTDVNHGEFEKAVLSVIAWCNELPPEIFTLAFDRNYSASQASLNMLRAYQDVFICRFTDEFCGYVWEGWLLNAVLRGRINAPGLLEAWRDPMAYETYGAWVSTEWYGSVIPATRVLDVLKSSELKLRNGYSTHSRESRQITGTKHSTNMKRLMKEAEAIVEYRKKLAEAMPQETSAPVANRVEPEPSDDAVEAAAQTLVEAIGQRDEDIDFVEGFTDVIRNAS